jgi:hypothetical protein
MANKTYPPKTYLQISYEEFKVLCNQGQTYTGLVTSVGWVSWTSVLDYFVNISPNRFVRPTYKLIQTHEQWIHRSAYKEVISKKRYILHIIPPDVLLIDYPDAYWQLYPEIAKEREQQMLVAVNDAIQPPKRVIPPYIPIGNSQSQSPFKPIAETVAEVDYVLGIPYSVANELNIIKGNRYLEVIIAGICIYNDISDGNYFSAAGRLLTTVVKMSWYGIAWDIVTLPFGKEQRIKAHHQVYEEAERNFIKANDEGDVNEREYQRKRMRSHAESLRDLGSPVRKGSGPYYLVPTKY